VAAHPRLDDVKYRADSTTSERQLLLAMTDAGRPASLAELAVWRKDGLLPPLASHGLGPGKGKSYYWREPNIVSQACTAFDCLKKYGRSDTAIWMLFLSGFRISLPQFRRAWAYRSKTRSAWEIRSAENFLKIPDGQDILEGLDARGNTSLLLLNFALTLCGAVAPDEDGEDLMIVELLQHTLGRVTRANDIGAATSGMPERLWSMIRIVGAALETSSLIADTSDDDLRDAQQYLCAAGRLLHACNDQSSPGAGFADGAVWSLWLAERLGRPLLLLILVLMRSGRRDILQHTAQRLEGFGQRDRVPPPAAIHPSI
jgi:hypothetical protein